MTKFSAVDDSESSRSESRVCKKEDERSEVDCLFRLDPGGWDMGRGTFFSFVHPHFTLHFSCGGAPLRKEPSVLSRVGCACLGGAGWVGDIRGCCCRRVSRVDGPACWLPNKLKKAW